MSQLDLSIFYSHLFCLLLVFYVFSHVAVVLIINNYYNIKSRELENKSSFSIEDNTSNINILLKILD